MKSAIPVAELLRQPRQEQAHLLQAMSQKDLEILWYQIQRHGEALDQLKLTVFSILRDAYEAKKVEAHAPERVLRGR